MTLQNLAKRPEAFGVKHIENDIQYSHGWKRHTIWALEIQTKLNSALPESKTETHGIELCAVTGRSFVTTRKAGKKTRTEISDRLYADCNNMAVDDLQDRKTKEFKAFAAAYERIQRKPPRNLRTSTLMLYTTSLRYPSLLTLKNLKNAYSEGTITRLARSALRAATNELETIRALTGSDDETLNKTISRRHNPLGDALNARKLLALNCSPQTLTKSLRRPQRKFCRDCLLTDLKFIKQNGLGHLANIVQHHFVYRLEHPLISELAKRYGKETAKTVLNALEKNEDNVAYVAATLYEINAGLEAQVKPRLEDFGIDPTEFNEIYQLAFKLKIFEENARTTTKRLEQNGTLVLSVGQPLTLYGRPVHFDHQSLLALGTIELPYGGYARLSPEWDTLLVFATLDNAKRYHPLRVNNAILGEISPWQMNDLLSLIGVRLHNNAFEPGPIAPPATPTKTPKRGSGRAAYAGQQEPL